MSVSHKFLDVIDEYKESIPDDIYLNICNKAKDLHTYEQKIEELYKITFLEPFIEKSKWNHFKINMKRKSLFVPLSSREVNNIKRELKQNNSITAHIIYDKMEETNHFKFSYTKIEFDHNLYEMCIDQNDGISCNCENNGDCGLVNCSTEFEVDAWREIIKIEKYKPKK